MEQRRTVNVKCAICDEAMGEIEIPAAFSEDVAICEFCYLNMKGFVTTDGTNKFYIEG